MSFKNPVRADKLEQVKAKSYVKMLALLLSKKLLSGNSTSFVMLLNHIYADMDESKSAKLPLFLLGDGDSSWKDFHKQTTKDGDSQKKHMVSGSCRRNGDELILSIEGSKGLTKIPNKQLQYLDALVKKINKNYSISTTGGTPIGTDAVTQKGVVETIKKETRNMDKTVFQDLKNSEEVTAYKTEKQEEAKKLNSSIQNLQKMIGSSLKVVSKNVKNGATSKKDIDLVKAANQAFSDATAIYDKTAPQVRKKFESVYNKLIAQKGQLVKLSMAAKQQKKSLAQRMADAYYENMAQRKASETEIKQFQTIVKSAIDLNKSSKKPVDQELLLKATSFVVKKVGVDKFDVRYVNQVLEKKAA